jgi:hypothetical protein
MIKDNNMLGETKIGPMFPTVCARTRTDAGKAWHCFCCCASKCRVFHRRCAVVATINSVAALILICIRLHQNQ